MIAYSPTPILREFHMDDHFVRGVIGPFASGKSVAMCWEIYFRSKAMPKGPDGFRKSRWAVIRNCYDDQTEILTERRGWVPFSDLDPSEAVASLQDGKMVFEVPSAHYQYPYEGEMIGVKSQNIDLLVTPEHEMWVSTRRTRKKVWGDFEHIQAQDIYGVGDLYRCRSTCEWDGQTEESLDFFEFLGFWFAEGYAGLYPRKDCVGTHYRLVVSQKNSDGYVEDLLERNDLPYSVHDKGDGNCNYAISINDDTKALCEELSQYGKALNKWLPNWIKDAPKEHLLAFLRGFQYGDGSSRDVVGVDRLYTYSPALADDLHEIIVKAGMAATVQSVDQGDLNTKYQLTILTPLRSSPVIQKRHWYKENYKGMVYCVTVPSHVVLVRRNGIATWCGQTKEQLKDTTLRTWHEWFPDGVAGRFVSSEMTYFLEYEDIKTEVLFRALDKPDDIRKLLSMELTGAFVNEAREIPWAVIDGLTGRVGRYPRYRDMEHIKPENVAENEDTGLWEYPNGALWEPYWSGIIMDTNPPDEDHWWYKKFEVQVHEDEQVAELYRCFHQPAAVFRKDDRWVTNPKAENLKNLKPGYYESMVVGKDAEWVKVYAQGKYGIVSDGRPVHSGYNDDWHCRTFDFDPRLPVYVGWDYSFRGQACVLAQLSKRGQLRIFDEFVGEETGIALEDFVFNAVKPGLAKYKAQYQASVGDPAGMKKGDLDERFALALLNDQYEEVQFSLPFTTEAADTNSLGPRLEGVDHYLNRNIDGAPAFLLHPRCAVLRKGFLGRYEYKRVQVVGEERYKDVPNKNRYSHPQDALQYLIRGILMDFGQETEEHVEERKVGLSGY